MSKDPFDELFGDQSDATQPITARERQERGRAEQPRTAQLPQTKRQKNVASAAAAGGDATTVAKPRTDHPAKTWVIIGIIAVLALLGSAVLVNALRGSGDNASPTPTQQSPQATTPAPSDEDPNVAGEDDPDATDDGDDDQVPEVNVGNTFTMPVDPWGVEVDVSGSLPDISYNISGDSMVVSSGLIDSYKAACADTPGDWGMTRVSADKFEVLKPAERCEAESAVYDELWGQMAAMADSARPL